MPGKLSNFMKNFDKIKDYLLTSPYVQFAQTFVPAVFAGYNLYNNLNKLDDPNATSKDKAVNIAKAILAPTSLIPGLEGTVASTLAKGAVDAASYVTDVMEGKKDAPPKPADVNMRTNQIGSMPNQIINSVPFRKFYGNFGF
jgi:hypothetical protein